MVVLVVLVQSGLRYCLELQERSEDVGSCQISSWRVLLPIPKCVVGWRCQLTVVLGATIEVVEQLLLPYSGWLLSD